jgi:hypothetical protein
MIQSPDNKIGKFLATPIGRRAVLALGAQGAVSLYTALGVGAALSLFGSLTGCYRAPGTARDQLIFFSEEKELQFGLSAFREVLRSAPLSDNAEVNDLVHRVGRKIAETANKPVSVGFAVIQRPRNGHAVHCQWKVATFSPTPKLRKRCWISDSGRQVAHAQGSVTGGSDEPGGSGPIASGRIGGGGFLFIQTNLGVSSLGRQCVAAFNRKRESEADHWLSDFMSAGRVRSTRKPCILGARAAVRQT